MEQRGASGIFVMRMGVLDVCGVETLVDRYLGQW
jgi:hypothetical protein